MLQLEVDSDAAGTRIRIKAHGSHRELVNIEYDADTRRLFVWDMTNMDNEAADIVIPIPEEVRTMPADLDAFISAGSRLYHARRNS